MFTAFPWFTHIFGPVFLAEIYSWLISEIYPGSTPGIKPGESGGNTGRLPPKLAVKQLDSDDES